jgi:hypothetical protein
MLPSFVLSSSKVRRFIGIFSLVIELLVGAEYHYSFSKARLTIDDVNDCRQIDHGCVAFSVTQEDDNKGN